MVVIGGSGRFSIPLSKKGFKIVTLDYDPLPLRKLSEKDEKIPLIRADAQQLPFRDGIFDCVLAI